MANIVHTIKLVADAKKAMDDVRLYQDQIVSTAQTVKRHEAKLSGDKILKSANDWTAAVAKLGGATKDAATNEQLLAGVAKLSASEKQRINGILTEAIEKYRLLGKEAPAAMVAAANATKKLPAETSRLTSALTSLNSVARQFGLGVSAGSVIAFGKSILDAGDAIVKTSDRTGLLLSEVQKLQYIGGQAGNSLDELTSAANQMQDRLTSGDKSAVGAVKALGLNLQTLRNESPYQQLESIATAMASIQDPAERVTVAMDLFGKSGAAIMPTLISDFNELAAAAPVMSDETVRSLDDAGDAIARLKSQTQVLGAGMVELFSHLGDGIVLGLYPALAKVLDALAAVPAALLKIPGAAKVIPNLQRDTDSLRQSAQWFRDAVDAQGRQLDVVAQKAEQARHPIRRLATAHTEAAAATKRHEKAVTELTPEAQHASDLLGRAKDHEAERVKFAESAWRSWGQTVSKALQNIQSSPVLLKGRDLSGLVPQIDASGAGNLAGFTLPPAAKAGFFASIFGSPADFGKQMTLTIMGALQGGGNLFAAASGAIGSTLGAGVAGKFSERFLKDGAGGLFTKALGGGLSPALPVVGSAVRPLVNKVWGHFFGTAGRDAVKDFAADHGGFDELHRELLEVGDAGEAMWIRITQRVGRNDAEGARAAIAAANDLLEEHRRKTEEAATAAEEAAHAVTVAQQQAVDDAEAALKALDDEIAGLQKSIDSESPKEVRGVVEAQARARLDALNKEREAAAQHVEEVQGALSEAPHHPSAAIEKIRHDIEIRVRTSYDGTPGGAPIPMADGGDFIVTRPTLFLAGEAGPERATFTPRGQARNGGTTILQPVAVNVDGRQFLQTLIDVSHAQGAL